MCCHFTDLGFHIGSGTLLSYNKSDSDFLIEIQFHWGRIHSSVGKALDFHRTDLGFILGILYGLLISKCIVRSKPLEHSWVTNPPLFPNKRKRKKIQFHDYYLIPSETKSYWCHLVAPCLRTIPVPQRFPRLPAIHFLNTVASPNALKCNWCF